MPNPPPTDLRAIDWANREYVPGLDHLKNGRGELREYSEDYAGLHDTTTWELVMSSFGDLDGDGQEEAVIVLKESWFPPSGEGRAEEKGYVFRLVNKKVVQVGSPLRAAHVQSVAVLQDRIILFDGGCSVYRLQDEAWQRQPEEHCPAE